jgi:thioredoxin-like negative regulator of GroEL
MDIGRHFGVMGTPSVVLVEDGTIRDYLVGAKSETLLRKLMD